MVVRANPKSFPWDTKFAQKGIWIKRSGDSSKEGQKENKKPRKTIVKELNTNGGSQGGEMLTPNQQPLERNEGVKVLA